MLVLHALSAAAGQLMSHLSTLRIIVAAPAAACLALPPAGLPADSQANDLRPNENFRDLVDEYD